MFLFLKDHLSWFWVSECQLLPSMSFKGRCIIRVCNWESIRDFFSLTISRLVLHRSRFLFSFLAMVKNSKEEWQVDNFSCWLVAFSYVARCTSCVPHTLQFRLSQQMIITDFVFQRGRPAPPFGRLVLRFESRSYYMVTSYTATTLSQTWHRYGSVHQWILTITGKMQLFFTVGTTTPSTSDIHWIP